MNIIDRNTEEILAKDLKQYWEKEPTQRCVYFKSSHVENKDENWLEEFTEILKRHVDERACRLYVCHDGDVFIIARSLTQKSLNEFLSYLTHLKLVPARDIDGLAFLFEIGVDWARLRDICEGKLRALQIVLRAKQSAEKVELQQASTQETVKTIDKDLVANLADRRSKRVEPEIMVVEDDPFSQKLVGNALKEKYGLSITADGAGALMNYVSRAPDVLFLDIGLPDINGHEVLEKLFKIDPNAYVVMFSGNGDKDNIMRAVELGAKGFVGKPFTQDKLFQYIEKSPFIQQKKQREMRDANLHD